jgi:hypothetical protein
MIIDTYQSSAVMRILQSGEVYWAKPSISFKGEYAALIDMLGLHCECPIFGVVRGRKQNTGGRVSGAVRIRLNVPREYVRLTEYTVWVDFMTTSSTRVRRIIQTDHRRHEGCEFHHAPAAHCGPEKPAPAV